MMPSRVTRARRHLAIDERKRSQSLVPLRANVSESGPGDILVPGYRLGENDEDQSSYDVRRQDC